LESAKAFRRKNAARGNRVFMGLALKNGETRRTSLDEKKGGKAV